MDTTKPTYEPKTLFKINTTHIKQQHQKEKTKEKRTFRFIFPRKMACTLFSKFQDSPANYAYICVRKREGRRVLYKAKKMEKNKTKQKSSRETYGSREENPKPRKLILSLFSLSLSLFFSLSILMLNRNPWLLIKSESTFLEKAKPAPPLQLIHRALFRHQL